MVQAGRNLMIEYELQNNMQASLISCLHLLLLFPSLYAHATTLTLGTKARGGFFCETFPPFSLCIAKAGDEKDQVVAT